MVPAGCPSPSQRVCVPGVRTMSERCQGRGRATLPARVFLTAPLCAPVDLAWKQEGPGGQSYRWYGCPRPRRTVPKTWGCDSPSPHPRPLPAPCSRQPDHVRRTPQGFIRSPHPSLPQGLGARWARALLRRGPRRLCHRRLGSCPNSWPGWFVTGRPASVGASKDGSFLCTVSPALGPCLANTWRPVSAQPADKHL